MSSYIRFYVSVILSVLSMSLGLTGCVTTAFRGQGSSDESISRLVDGTIRIEVSVSSETLLDRVSVGCGFLLSDETGVTCAHIFQGRLKGNPVKAYISGREYDLQLIGMNEKSDIAVFKLYPPVSAGLLSQRSVEPLVVGQDVRVLGFPLPGVIVNNSPSVTGGIVSGIDRSIIIGSERIDGLIQVDAVSSQGNSGGPVTAGNGRIVGMVIFAATSAKAEWRGATFALPIKMVESTAEDIIQKAECAEKEQSKETSGPSTVKLLLTR